MWENSGSKRRFSINGEGGEIPRSSQAAVALKLQDGGGDSFFFFFPFFSPEKYMGGGGRSHSSSFGGGGGGMDGVEKKRELNGFEKRGGGKAWVVKMGSKKRERKEKFGSVPCPPKWV